MYFTVQTQKHKSIDIMLKCCAHFKMKSQCKMLNMLDIKSIIIIAAINYTNSVKERAKALTLNFKMCGW